MNKVDFYYSIVFFATENMSKHTIFYFYEKWW